jgi:hypothetical protein
VIRLIVLDEGGLLPLLSRAARGESLNSSDRPPE